MRDRRQRNGLEIDAKLWRSITIRFGHQLPRRLPFHLEVALKFFRFDVSILSMSVHTAFNVNPVCPA